MDKPEVVLMNSDELFAMGPSKKVDRWLFRGELRETKVTKRNPSHSSTVSNLAYLFSRSQVLTAPRVLPGFRCFVRELFE